MHAQRSYQNDEDYWRIRAFLRTLYLLNNRIEYSWQAYRFDYWRWHGVENIDHFSLSNVVWLWETNDGQIAAVLNPESRGQAFLHIHPASQSPDLIAEMLFVAERYIALHTAGGTRKLTVWAVAEDAIRKASLTSAGYHQTPFQEMMRRRPMEELVPKVELQPGFRVHSLGYGAEFLDRCYASGLAFHPDDINQAVQYRTDPGWYHNIQRAPLYRRDLDLVVTDEAGAVAAFCTVWFDDVTRTGAFEPVGTIPKYQRQGLGKVLMHEGLRRLQHLGATRATVGSYEEPAHRLYQAAGFRDYTLNQAWLKEWQE